jgi:ATP-dependent DNA helicase RecG
VSAFSNSGGGLIILGLDEHADFSPVDVDRLNDRQRLALAFLHRNGRITNQQYRSVTGTDSLAATRELTGLAAEGLIEKTSDRRWAVWTLVGAKEANSQRRLEFTEETSPPFRRDRRQQILDLLRSGPQSSRYLADSLGMTKEGVLQWLRRMEESGEVEPTSDKRRSRLNTWRLVAIDKMQSGDSSTS